VHRQPTSNQIEDLRLRTETGDVRWVVDGRRARTAGYRLDLRPSGGAVLYRIDAGGVEGPSARSRLGFGPAVGGRGRAVRRLARAVMDQAVAGAGHSSASERFRGVDESGLPMILRRRSTG
jgi:hypothetical protein